MNCQNCLKPYNSTNNSPLLLISCGHSICHACASSIFQDKCLICPECQTENRADTVNKFPKNLALISVKKQKQSPTKLNIGYRRKDISKKEKEVSLKCKKHKKPVEAFCQKEC